MKALLSCSRTVLLAALASGLVAAIGPVAAQQQTKAPAVNPSPAPVPGLPAQAPGASPPSWAQGRPDTPEVTNIAPVVPPPIPAAVDKLPVAKPFQRAFDLPASVDRDKVAADFSKGVLTITLPKTAEARKPEKKIAVKST